MGAGAGERGARGGAGRRPAPLSCPSVSLSVSVMCVFGGVSRAGAGGAGRYRWQRLIDLCALLPHAPSPSVHRALFFGLL